MSELGISERDVGEPQIPRRINLSNLPDVPPTGIVPPRTPLTAEQKIAILVEGFDTCSACEYIDGWPIPCRACQSDNMTRMIIVLRDELKEEGVIHGA